MVYRPEDKNKKRPTHVAGQYLVGVKESKTSKRSAIVHEFNDNAIKAATQKLVGEISTLIKSEKRNDVAITDTLDFIGLVIVKCDQEFADKMQALPSAEYVQQAATRYAAAAKPTAGAKLKK